MTEVLILYYSRYGTTARLAQLIAQGVESVEGVRARLRRVPPIDSDAEKLKNKEVTQDPLMVPNASLEDLMECQGLALGSPTRFGNMAAPLKFFLEQTGGFWATQALRDKVAMCFTVSSTLHGGQESTLLSMQIPLLHQGMILVGGDIACTAMNSTQTGGTPYGPSALSNRHKTEISEEERAIAIASGARLAQITHQLHRQG